MEQEVVPWPKHEGPTVERPLRNPLLFPPRGPERPTLRKILSEPALATEFLGLGPQHEKHREIAKPNMYHSGLEDMMKCLDRQNAKLRREATCKRKLEKNAERNHKEHENMLAATSVSAEPPPWNSWHVMECFENPMPIDRTPSLTTDKNDRQMGIYDVKEFKPPHHEENVKGLWDPHQKNEFGEMNGMFRTKQKKRMGPTEKKFADRLDRVVQKQERLASIDAVNQTTGSWKRSQIEGNAGPHSSLNRTLPPWVDQTTTDHLFFSIPDASVPGDNLDFPGIGEYVSQPQRTLSYERDFICGDGERTSHWRGVKPGVTGSTTRLDMANGLLLMPGEKRRFDRTLPNPKPSILTFQQHRTLAKSRSMGGLSSSKGSDGCPTRSPASK